MNLEIFTDEFTAMPIQSLNDILPARGATGGLTEPSGIAKHYCGIETFSVGDIMAYGFRRFGYPVNGWDDYKELCEWILTTPMEGVFLTVKPTTVSPFGYLLKDPLTQQLNEEQTAPFFEWGKQCRKWVKETYNIILINQMHWAGRFTDEEFNIASNQWLQETYPEYYDERDDTLKQLASRIGIPEDKIAKRFWKEKREECERLSNEFEKIVPSPKGRERSCHELEENVPEIPFWQTLPKESLERQINEALYRAILDLKRPVSVRDWQLTIDGEDSDDTFCKYAVDEDGDETDELLYDYYAPKSRMAGYGVDPDTVGNDDWYKVQKIFCQQFGSVRQGIQQLIKFLSDGGSLNNKSI